MRLATMVHAATSGTTAAVQVDGGWRGLPWADVGALLADDSWRRVTADANGPILSDAEETLLLPSPSKIICAGLNYADHILEMGRELPTYPTLFAKFADTLCGPTDDIVVYDASTSVDWEAELAVVIGRHITRGNEEEAALAIAGYTIANDISVRDWQNRTVEFLQGKAFDRTTPIGPVLVTPDELDPVAGLDIGCTVNGEVMQAGNTRTLVFSSATLVAYVSQFTTLRPGDVILTGTPGGVGAGRKPPLFLRDGDVVSTTIEGIGELRNTYRHRPASVSTSGVSR